MFAVYHHPVHGYVAVKVGWSLAAFFFNPFWLLVKGLWRQFFILLTIFFAVGVVWSAASGGSQDSSSAAMAANDIASIFGFAVAIYVSHEGNRWLAEKLVRRGFAHVATFAARNKSQAVSLATGGVGRR